MAGPLSGVPLPALGHGRVAVQHPFVGAGDRSAGDSAAWLVP
jgi:hypothetical protein